MSKYTLKTQVNDADVNNFINSIEIEQKKEDCYKIIDLMVKVSKEKPKMWGKSIVGFGAYHYKYESGHEGDSIRIGFSPRKNNIVIYNIPGFSNLQGELIKLGKHKTGKSCLYINELSEINLDVLEKIIKNSFDYMNKKYPN